MFKITSQLLLFADRKYSSTQIDAPKNIADIVMNFNKENIKEKDLFKSDDSFGREKNVHITVKFGIHTKNADEIKGIVSDFGGFDIELGTVSKFESDEYDVIKVSVKSPQLHELNKLIADSTECTDTHPKYIPHLTLAYVKPGSCDFLLDNEELDGLSWHVREIVFSSVDEEKSNISL
jgi:2'-5' RNA ligase